MTTMEDWDPREVDYADKTFNSYTKGPGRNLCIKKNYVKGSERHVQLYVTGIPDELTEEGLESLFGRAGNVIRVKKMMSKKENAGDTFGFITMGSLSDAERAIAQYNNFKINRFTIRVSVSLSKEELEKKKQQKQDLGMLTARGFDEAFSDSDSSLMDLNSKPNMMNGVGNAGAASSALGAGRGQRLREIAQTLFKHNPPVPIAQKFSLQNSSTCNTVSPSGYANLTSKRQPKAGSYPTTQLDNLTVQVDKAGGHSVSHTTGGFMDTINLQTPIGRGKFHHQGKVTDNGYESSYAEDYFAPKRGRGGRGRGKPSRGRGQRGRGNNYRDYYDDYDGGYGGYQQPYMGRGMGFPGYPMPVYVADPYMSMMNSSHLLQPAYNQMMNSNLMNASMQQQQQQMSMPQQTPLPQQTPMPKIGGENKYIKQECSVCGKLGSSRCSKCKIPYCSATCQEKDWPEHRKVCHTISKEREDSEALSNFDVTVGDELIPQVKKLMEKATGDIIEVTKKPEYSPKPPSESGSSRGQGRRNEKRGQQSDDDDKSSDRRRNDSGNRGTDDRRGQMSRDDDESGKKTKPDDRKSVKNNRDDKACFNCGETTHMRSDCPQPSNYKMECYLCHQKGHISKDCPGKLGRCYNCHERGHISKDCPLKPENLAKNASNNKRDDNKRWGTSQTKLDDEEWDDKPVSPKPVSSQKQSMPVCESTPKECKIATRKKSIPSPPPKKSLQTATMPLNKEVTVVLTAVDDPGHFYLQMAVDETEKLQDLMAVMHQTFESSQSDVNSVLQGEIYGARFTCDGSWNRAQVVSVSGDSILVHFLDFGNKDTVKFDDLRQLTNEMMQLPAQGVLCALEGVTPKSGNSWNISDLNNYIRTDIPYKAECKRVVNTPVGRVNEIVLRNMDGEDVSKKLVSANLVRSKTVPDANLNHATMPLNQEVMVVLTAVDDPGHFYLQMAVDETEKLQDLMAVMHQTFEGSQPNVKSVLQGETYGARFSLDGSWNRAQVASISGDSILVQFLDFGNKDTVNLNDLRQLTHEMMKLPAQGVLCALEGVAPKSGNSWNIPDLSNYIRTDVPYKAECKRVVDTPVGRVNEIVLRNMDGEDVSKKLLSANLVRSKTARDIDSSPQRSGSAVQQVTGSNQERLMYVKDLPKYVERLRVNVEYPLMIADAKTPIDFSIQILDEENTAQFTAFNIHFNEECNRMTDTEYRPKAVGELVASQFSQEIGWYRAEVLELVPNGAKVLYIDYLNLETVTFNMMRKAPTMCETFPIQGISSCMYDVLEPEDGKWPKEIFVLYEHLSQSALRGTVKDIKNDTVTMELRELSGELVNEKIKSILKKTMNKPQMNMSGKIRPGELPLDGSKIPVVVTNVSAIDSVYVQGIDERFEKKKNEMMLELNQSLTGVEERQPYEPKEGEYVAAVYILHGTAFWYRALVKVKVSEKNFMVLFVDYGNEECVGTEAIAPLEPRLLTLPAMAIRCQLSGSEDIVDEQTLINLKSLTDNKMYVKAVDYVGGLYKVEMFLEDGTNVNEAFDFKTDKGAIPKVTKSPPKAVTKSPPKAVEICQFDIAESTIPLDGTKVLSKVVLIDSLASFYCHKLDEDIDAKLMECLKAMQLHYRDNHQVYTGKVGEYVAVLFDDGSGAVWYRAKILGFVENTVKVSIIDYGNVGFVDRDYVCQLEKDFTVLPAVAVKCKLNGSTGEENGETVQEFMAVQTTNVRVKGIKKQGDTYLVDLHLIDALETSVADLLDLKVEQPLKTPEKEARNIANNLSPKPVLKASPRSPVSSLYQNTSGLSGSMLPLGVDVHAVTYVIEGVRSFYVQKADDETQKDLASMMVELAGACATNTREHKASAGEIVAALFEDGGDANWYRGQVLELIDSNQCKVMFVDYGNTEIVLFAHIRRLESRFLQLPRMAIHCALAGIASETESMFQKFKTISNVPMTVRASSEQNGVFEVEVITSDNVNMNRELGLMISTRASLSPSTEIVDHLPKEISPGKDRLPKKVSSPPKGERKAVFTQTLAKSRPKQEEFIAVVTSVVRPNLFHCQVFLEGAESSLQDLQFLSETMQLECEAEFYNITSLKFEVGELCCAKYPVDNKWYRASVLEIFPDNTVKVEYVDFGNQTEVSASQLRPVTEDYTRLPLLAFRCMLHGVRPTGGNWTKQVVEEMRKFQDKQLLAKVISVNKDVYDLDLTDKDTNVNMAQYLIASGLAIADDTQNEGMSEMERLKREKELLQRQLEDMQAKMAAIQKYEK